MLNSRIAVLESEANEMTVSLSSFGHQTNADVCFVIDSREQKDQRLI